MDDVFEDFASDQEFSDVEESEGHSDGDEDEEEAALSDDEIARMLGLMDDGGHKLPKVKATDVPETQEKSIAVKTTVHDGDGGGMAPVGVASSDVAASTQPFVHAVASQSAPAPDMSDFDRFLQDFTRQQRTPQKKQEVVVIPPSPLAVAPPACSGHTVQEEDKDDNCVVLHDRVPAPVTTRTPPVEMDRPNLLSQRWGVFHPEMMPVRHEAGSVGSVFSTSTLSPQKNHTQRGTHQLKKKLRVVVPSVAFLRDTNTRRHRHHQHQHQHLQHSINKELTFVPTINKNYYRRRGMARLRVHSQRDASFASRMQKDIHDRRVRQQKRIRDKQQHENAVLAESQSQQRRGSLVAKGSQAILQRNGLWTESMDERLERLVRKPHAASASLSSMDPPTTKAKRKRLLKAKETAKTRACESLYKRGVDKLQRTREAEKNPKTTKRQQHPSTSSSNTSRRHTDAIVRQRLAREVALICASDSSSGQQTLPSFISFVEFSCVLLYFGLVPEATTPWEDDPEVTLLWRAWMAFAEGHGDNRRVAMPQLKRLLETVMVDVSPSSSTTTSSRKKTKTKIKKEDDDDDDQGMKARLMRRFRVNYIARKRSRGISDVPHDPRTTTTTTRSTSSLKRSSTSTTTYSLHGRAVRSGAGSRRNGSESTQDDDDDPLAARHSLTQQRMEELRRAKQQDEIAECTFKPRIISTAFRETTTHTTSENSADGSNFRSSPQDDEEDAPETFERLYSDAFVRQHKNMARSYQARMDEEEKWKKESRICPTYVNGLTIDERLHKLHEELSNNALPVNFHHKISEMRSAYAAKVDEAREKQSRLEPAAHQFPRTKEGHTLVVPFTFATDERKHRSSQYEKHTRRTRAPSSKSTRALIRDLQFVYEGSPVETTAMDHEYQDEIEETAAAAADLCIDVHVSPFETYPLCLNRDDDVEEATRVNCN